MCFISLYLFSANCNPRTNTFTIEVIRDFNNSWNGHDFGIDYLSFSDCSTPQISLSGNTMFSQVKNFSLFIYNRLEEKIFETADTSKGRDGSYNGEKEKTEVYILFIYKGNT